MQSRSRRSRGQFSRSSDRRSRRSAAAKTRRSALRDGLQCFATPSPSSRGCGPLRDAVLDPRCFARSRAMWPTHSVVGTMLSPLRGNEPARVPCPHLRRLDSPIAT
jgi:hypothetical protein